METLVITGVTEIDASVAGVTVSVVVPDMFVAGSMAVIETEPVAVDVAKPFEPDALLMLETLSSDDFQVADTVRSWCEPSVYVPVAVNCFVVPRGMLGLVGVTEIDTSVAGVTVSVVVPDTFVAGSMAVIETEAVAIDVAKPFEPDALLILATPVVDDPQVTDAVKFCVVLSVYVPVAVNCFVVPRGMLGLVGVTEIDTSVAGVTVSVVVPDMFVAGSVAVIVAEPVPAAVAKPLEPDTLLTLAMLVDDELHVTDVVIS